MLPVPLKSWIFQHGKYLFEARIVNIDTTYEEELGVKFGVSNTRHLSGTFNGAAQLTESPNIPIGNVPVNQRLNFNFPLRNCLMAQRLVQ